MNEPQWTQKRSEHRYTWGKRAIIEGDPQEWSVSVYYPDWDAPQWTAHNTGVHSRERTLPIAKQRAERLWNSLKGIHAA